MIVAIQGQTLWDLSLQEYGSIEGVFQLLAENTAIASVNSNVFPGMQLIAEGKLIDTEVQSYYKKNNITISSGFKPSLLQFNSDFNEDFN